MTKTIDLLHGKIMRSLCILAVPIVMTYFIQMAYNFIDMIWIGHLGSGAVAGVGVAGMFTWFSNGLVMMAKMGGQVKIGHCLGAVTTMMHAAISALPCSLASYLPCFSALV